MTLYYSDTDGNIKRVVFQRASEPTVHSMNLAEAVVSMRDTGWACACRGGEWCCIRVNVQAHDTQRVAHIIARQLSDLAEKRRNG